jgi:hypothetical protein
VRAGVVAATVCVRVGVETGVRVAVSAMEGTVDAVGVGGRVVGVAGGLVGGRAVVGVAVGAPMIST